MPFDLHIHLRLLTSVFSIIFINVVLSGDNAVVIAMASRRLPPRERKRAILAGGLGAIGLRIVFTALATILLHVPLLQMIGGIVLVWVAYKLLADDEGGHEIQAAGTLWGAIQTIILADFLMSLDNILAVGGASHGSFELLLFGLITSMPLILLGSSLIARLMASRPWLSTVGAVILTITAARMVAEDHFVHEAIHGGGHLALTVGLAIVFSLAAVLPTYLRRGPDDRMPPATA
jgi:YjbE family integral membrane protein